MKIPKINPPNEYGIKTPFKNSFILGTLFSPIDPSVKKLLYIKKIKSKKPSKIFPPSSLVYSLLPKIHSQSFRLNTVIIGKVIGFPTNVPIKDANTFALSR